MYQGKAIVFTSDMNSPFYGVWVYGSKDKADADNFAANGALETAKGLGYTEAYVKYSGEHK